uniref:Uncharacterized protein n=1 Tax=Anguilla anguilla TaxID=7936 RepID=A0A0E9WSB6_ANGAN
MSTVILGVPSKRVYSLGFLKSIRTSFSSRVPFQVQPTSFPLSRPGVIFKYLLTN